MTDTLSIEALRELEAAATPGPWEVDEGYQGFGPQQPLRIRFVDVDADNDGRAHDYGHVIVEFPEDHVNDDTDAALIIAMRNSLPTLLSEHTLLRDRVAELTEALQNAAGFLDTPIMRRRYGTALYLETVDSLRATLNPPEQKP